MGIVNKPFVFINFLRKTDVVYGILIFILFSTFAGTLEYSYHELERENYYDFLDLVDDTIKYAITAYILGLIIVFLAIITPVSGSLIGWYLSKIFPEKINFEKIIQSDKNFLIFLTVTIILILGILTGSQINQQTNYDYERFLIVITYFFTSIGISSITATLLIKNKTTRFEWCLLMGVIYGGLWPLFEYGLLSPIPVGFLVYFVYKSQWANKKFSKYFW